MSQDTQYKSLPILFKSRGIVARPIIDRAPEHTYLNLDNLEEREEDALSSRYGSIIINRDPDGTPNGKNYLLPFKPTTLTRLKSLSGAVYRYANSGRWLYRRVGDSQGPYSPIFSGLSGNPFSSVVASCFQSSQPFLFIADALKMLKDSGIGTPSQMGIFPPTQVANTLQYSPQIINIDNFLLASGYTVTGGFSIASRSVFATVNGTGGTPVLDYEKYLCGDKSARLTQSGMLGVDTQLRQIFDIAQDTSSFDVNPLGTPITATTALAFGAVNGSIGSNSTGTIGKSLSTDLSIFEDDDLFVLAIKVSSPAAVQEIRLQFDIDGSNYTSSYYYKSIIPASYQGGISLPQVVDPTQSINSEVFARASGASNLSLIGEPFQNILPTDDPSLQQLQPSQITTGDGSWSVIYLRKGDFLPVGNAGKPGLDWANVTGWQVQITTNTQGSTDLSLNALYLQEGSGPSSYGGVGYDARYTYFNANTGTPSNPSGIQYFATTPDNPGGVTTLIVLRQAIQVTGQYSPDPQVTHVKIYIRGGSANQNWFYADKIPNIVGTGSFSYKYTFNDSVLLQGDPLQLDNDVPVTSTLPVPIVTELALAITTPTAPFLPRVVTVTDSSAVFVPYQIVDIGTPENLEQVFVVTGGTGSFTACMQLEHDAGESVQVFSVPGQPLNLGALAYGNIWLAGDPNNPHLLYYSKAGFPESFSPAAYIKVSSPSDPIMAVINFRGTLFVATLTTWYQIFPGNPPYAQPTGSKHGLVAQFGWTQTESAIWYQAIDGIREFRGADGAYRTLDVEWLFQNTNQALTPIPLADPTRFSTFQMAFQNNDVFALYYDDLGVGHRLIRDTNYQRWRNDDVNATAIYFEEDTNVLLYAKFLTAGIQSGYAICQDRIGDFDDGGWVNGQLVETAIDLNLQTPYLDQNMPNNQKQYNGVTIDANTAGQTLTVSLIFDDGITTLVLGTIESTIRQKFQLSVNEGLGEEAYRVSLNITGPVVDAPIIYGADIHAAPLAEQRSSYDSYWIKFGSDESKLIKQGYFDYTSDGTVSVSLYADGGTIPYYSFTLPANPTRSQVAERVRFPTKMCRMWRVVMTVATGRTLQVWQAPQVDQKSVCVGKGYQRSELVTS